MFELPFYIGLSKLFCASFKTASVSLLPLSKMINIEEKSRTLNFKRFDFPMEFQMKVAFEMKDPKSWCETVVLHGYFTNYELWLTS